MLALKKKIDDLRWLNTQECPLSSFMLELNLKDFFALVYLLQSPFIFIFCPSLRFSCLVSSSTSLSCSIALRVTPPSPHISLHLPKHFKRMNYFGLSLGPGQEFIFVGQVFQTVISDRNHLVQTTWMDLDSERFHSILPPTLHIHAKKKLRHCWYKRRGGEEGREGSRA